VAQEFEQHLKRRLEAELSSGEAARYYGIYEETRRKLIYNIYGAIAGANKDLSDHGEKHIENVMHNARKLISSDNEIHKLSALDLYCLAMFILFHDVGNLFGREDHRTKVGEVFDFARGTGADVRRERTLVLRAAMAHTGKAADGTADTLKEVNEADHLYDNRIQLRPLAAILRFSDELAEGPQRTSEFLRLRGAFLRNPNIYHEYASITNIHIDRADGRIVLTYDIDLTEGKLETSGTRDDRVRVLLEYTYQRIIKLDQERRYGRYYCPILAPFRMTSIEFNFHYKDRLLPHSLPQIQLDDYVVPGDGMASLEQISPAHDVNVVMRELQNAIEAAHT
jgi:hypothetical protein